MRSNEEFLAAVASMVERARNRVTRVTGVTDEAAAGGFAGACREVPVVSWDAAAGGSHTVTQVTRLHKHDDRDDDASMLERAAIVEHDGGLPREIADGLASLEGAPPPAGYSDAEWLDTVTAMALFVDQHGTEAIKLGWTAEDLFGVNPRAPAARCDKRGLASLLREGDRVVMLTTDAAVIERPSGSRATFQRQAHGAQSVPAWNLDTAA